MTRFDLSYEICSILIGDEDMMGLRNRFLQVRTEFHTKPGYPASDPFYFPGRSKIFFELGPGFLSAAHRPEDHFYTFQFPQKSALLKTSECNMVCNIKMHFFMQPRRNTRRLTTPQVVMQIDGFGRSVQ